MYEVRTSVGREYFVIETMTEINVLTNDGRIVTVFGTGVWIRMPRDKEKMEGN